RPHAPRREGRGDVHPPRSRRDHRRVPHARIHLQARPAVPEAGRDARRDREGARREPTGRRRRTRQRRPRTVTGFDAERFDRLVSQRAPAGRTPGAVAPGQPDEGGATHDADALDSLLVHSFMLFDATCADADRAAKKLYAAFIDLHELRVSRVDEIVAAIGARYPRAEDRASGLKRTLNDLFQRENAVTLAVIAEKNKRDARQFLCSLDGCPHYVASRLLLVGFGGHAIPVDDLLLARL